MIITTGEHIPGKEVVEIIGISRGSTVRARHLGRDIIAGLKTLIGGEISEYTQLQSDSRDEALKRLEQDALARGADAIIGVRIQTSLILNSTSEIIAYGTAVKLR